MHENAPASMCQGGVGMPEPIQEEDPFLEASAPPPTLTQCRPATTGRQRFMKQTLPAPKSRKISSARELPRYLWKSGQIWWTYPLQWNRIAYHIPTRFMRHQTRNLQTLQMGRCLRTTDFPKATSLTGTSGCDDDIPANTLRNNDVVIT